MRGDRAKAFHILPFQAGHVLLHERTLGFIESVLRLERGVGEQGGGTWSVCNCLTNDCDFNSWPSSVSHSHRDLGKVRRIRNELERRGHNPLLFFLKCMEDDDARLPELIRDEIKAREWFILCDSPHAKNSGRVQQEVKLIKGMEGKVFETIDLSQELQSELHKIVRLSKRATVFLSYASADRQAAEAIRRALLAHEFTATSPEECGASAQPIQAVVKQSD